MLGAGGHFRVVSELRNEVSETEVKPSHYNRLLFRQAQEFLPEISPDVGTYSSDFFDRFILKVLHKVLIQSAVESLIRKHLSLRIPLINTPLRNCLEILFLQFPRGIIPIDLFSCFPKLILFLSEVTELFSECQFVFHLVLDHFPESFPFLLMIPQSIIEMLLECVRLFHDGLGISIGKTSNSLEQVVELFKTAVRIKIT